jgi:hypothetical protein
MKYTQLFEEFLNEAMISVSNKSINSRKSKIDTSLIDKLVKQIAPVLNTEHSESLTKKRYEDVIMAIAKNISGSSALQDPGLIFERNLNEAKEYSFSFNYNTDEDDVEYVQNILHDAGVDAIAEPGIDSEEMMVKAKNAVELRKAKKAIQADGFEVNESEVNEGINVKDIKVGTILTFKDGETWKVTKTSGISSGKIFAAPYGETKKSYVSLPIEFSTENLEKDVTSIE